MKKVLFTVAAVAAFGLVSCGGPSMCDCVKGQEEMSEKMKEAGDDADKIKAIEEEYKADMEACKKMGEEKQKEMEGLSDEEKKAKGEEMMKELEACTK